MNLGFVVRIALIASCAFWFANAAELQSGEGAAPPQDGFATLLELEKWAQTSSFGGGQIEKMLLGDTEIYVVSRCFTSGLPVFEIMFYRRSIPAARFQSFFHISKQLGNLRVRQEQNHLVCARFNEQTKIWSTACVVYPDLLKQKLKKR